MVTHESPACNGYVKKLQVWRYSIYYFFVFGAFVALALWMPYYLVQVYGVDIKVAGMAAAAFSLSASVFRAYGGYLSDRFGARMVMYWTFGASLCFLFVLSYPPTDYVVHGKDGTVAFSTQFGLWPFVAVLFALGFFMSLGRGAVFKHIPGYFPNHVGAVGGLVGMIGGLGGFILPIVFGALLELTGVWTSSFILLFLLVAVALAWMHGSFRLTERKAHGAAIESLPTFPELSEGHDPLRTRMPRILRRARKGHTPAETLADAPDEALARVFAGSEQVALAERDAGITLALFTPVARTETLPLEAVTGRVVADPSAAPLPLPPIDSAAMDGYALPRAHLSGPGPG